VHALLQRDGVSVKTRATVHVQAGMRPLVFALVLAACSPASGREGTPRAPDAGHLTGGSDTVWSVPGWPDRDYLLHLPKGYAPGTPIPVVLGFHGGGGSKEGFVRTGCPDGDVASPGCLTAIADREGFAIVAPDGVDRPGIGKRSWNAGGGADGWRCVGGEACATKSDDVAYVDALLAEVERAISVDRDRIYATGISNGGAMSHRLACERADVFAAIAAVAGENQASAAPGCHPSRPVPVLQIHGTDDPCWGWDGEIRLGLCRLGSPGRFVGVDASMAAWRTIDACRGTTEEALPDVADDGTRTTRIRGTGCAADVELLKIEGGGHTWPGGWPYLRAVGRVARDFTGNEEIWDFFRTHPRVATAAPGG
jgi:polyhydroxybutyrate depolymerase